MMKAISAFALLCVMLTGCAAAQNAEPAGAPWGNAAVPPLPLTDGGLPDALVRSYYLPADDPVHAYLQHRSIQRFSDMWVAEALQTDWTPRWNYDTLAPVLLLDRGLNPVAPPASGLYTCTFSTDDGRCGYLTVSYHGGADGPAISQWGLSETTPYQYDLNANGEQLAAALRETDIDLSTATAARAEWAETDGGSTQILLFTDGKNDRYLCRLGAEPPAVEKQESSGPRPYASFIQHLKGQ